LVIEWDNGDPDTVVDVVDCDDASLELIVVTGTLD
jgi:hypothetical protein